MQTPSDSDQAETIAQAIFEAIADPVFVIDFIGDDIGPTFRFVNEAACRLLKRPRAELLKLRPGTIDDISQAVRDEAYDRLVSEGRATFETLMIAADGTRIPMEIHASDVMFSGRRMCIAVARSLVARKELARQMLDAKEAAEAANRAKSEFLAVMSHEIRTPLHGVIGFASLLEGADAPAPFREAVEGIRDSANHLLALVTDVLDFSRIEAGQLQLQPAPFDLPAQLRRITTAFNLRAREKGLAFRCLETTPIPPAILADSLRIEQVLGNLLGNALKFTEHGSITLAVGASGNRLSFTVSDTGIGIKADQIPLLFNRFSQADTTLSRRHGGSGLGLVIVRKLCELMGGTATVQSEFGKGSTFTASILAEPATLPRDISPIGPGAPLDDEIRALRILVAEDTPLNRTIMARMLHRLGCSVHFANDGAAARRMAGLHPCDLIFMDINMPVMDGIEATRAIRVMEQSTRRPPAYIIALTAGVTGDERKACAAVGMNDFLGKPFTEALLHAAIKRALLHRPG